MTRKPMLSLIVVIALAAGGSGGWAQAPGDLSGQPQFTTASLNGVCGFTFSSTNVVAGSGSFLQPRAGVGTLSLDGLGNATLSGTENSHGVVGPIKFNGTYSVGADGRTGTLNLIVAGTGFSAQFEIVNGGTELRFVNTGPVDPTAGIVKEVLIGACQF